MSAEEILDVVDEEDRVVGRLARAEVYARRLIHRCVFVLVRDGRDRARAGRGAAAEGKCDVFPRPVSNPVNGTRHYCPGTVS